MTKRIDSRLLKLTNRVLELEDILRRIELWESPWPGYVYHYGDRGQEQYIKSLAKHALYGTEIRFYAKIELAEIDHTYLKDMD